jgi:hypothetical protein
MVDRLLRRDTHDDGRPIFKRGLEDVVARTRAEPAHFDRPTKAAARSPAIALFGTSFVMNK